MQTASRTTLSFCLMCLFTLLIANNASANDGRGGFSQKTPVQRGGLGWWGNLRHDIGDFFSHLFGRPQEKPVSNSAPHPGGTSVPINGGIVFLLMAGIGLGVKMVKDRYPSIGNTAGSGPVF